MLYFGMDMPFLLMSFYGAVMILTVLILRALLKKRLPKFVFPLLWCVVLARLLIPFSLSSPLTVRIADESPLSALTSYLATLMDTETVGAIVETEAVENTPTTSIQTAVEDVTIRTNPAVLEGCAEYSLDTIDVFPRLRTADRHTLLLVVYLVGFTFTSGILLWQRQRYSRQLKNSLLVEHNETVNELLREMEMGHILVFTNDEIASPLTCGLLSPRIYLPTRMDFGDRELLRHILLHETMHIRRKDNWCKTFMLAALIVNWFNLPVWAMAKCFAADLESACDEAVLKYCHDEDERKSYAFHLLAMAITGSRTSLLYSAFSKTEVEKRIQSILHYKKASALLLAIAVCFMTCGTVAFATCAQAPFSPYFTSSCASNASRWGVKVYVTRSLSLGKDAQERAEDIVFAVLSRNTDNDPLHINEELLAALSHEFHVEPDAFRADIFLCLSEEELALEYAAWELTQDTNGIWHYKEEPVRILIDETGRNFYSHSEGTVDITVTRDRLGLITDVKTRHENEKQSTGRALPQPD